MFDDTKLLIHSVSNKLTAAMGYLSLAEEDAIHRISYLRKASRELKDASNHVTQLMLLINATARDAAKVAAEAAKAAKVAAEQLAKATVAADEMAEKAKTVADQVNKIVPISKPPSPPIPFKKPDEKD